MKNLSRNFTISLMFCFLFSTVLFAGKEKEIVKQYSGKDEVKIKLVLGSCQLEKSKDDDIHVIVVYSYDDDDFEAKFREKGKTLHIKEKLYGNNNGGHSSWTVSVPDGIEI